MRALAIVLLAGACAEPTGMGEAYSSVYPNATSATVTVANELIENGGASGTYRVWSIEIGEKPAGTDCRNRGDAVMVFEIYTSLSSAPRGTIRLVAEPPPLVFPAVAAYFGNGAVIDGEMEIDAASTSGLFGTFSGLANIDGAAISVDVQFDAPTCGV